MGKNQQAKMAMLLVLIFFLFLLGCVARTGTPTQVPAAVATPTSEMVTLVVQIHFVDDVTGQPLAADVYVGEQLVCAKLTVCELDFTKEWDATVPIPLRFRAEGYQDLDADMTDTVDQSGTFVLRIGLVPLGVDS